MNRMKAVFGLAVLASVVAAWACTSPSDFNAVSQSPADAGKKDTSSSAGDDDDGASATGFCAQHKSVLFCDDFDGKPLGSVWDGVEATNGSTTTDQVDSNSAPNSLLTKTSAITVTEGVRAVAKKGFSDFTGKPVGISVEFEMKVEQFDHKADEVMIAFGLLFGQDSDFLEIVVNLKSTGSDVVAQIAESGQDPDGGTPYALHGPFSVRPKIGDWSKIRFEVDINNTTGLGNLVRFYIDDQRQISENLKLPMKSATPRMELGVGWAQPPSDAWSIRYDDFTADLHTLN